MLKPDSDWFIIVNPHAGSGKTMSLWPVAQKNLDRLGVSYHSVLTNHKSHATSLARDAASAGFRRILGVGGDGTIHEIQNGILRWCEDNGTAPEEFYVGIAPIGSGNDWIKTLEVPHDVDAVTSLMAEGRFAPQDVVRVVSKGGAVRYMANIGGVGFDSHVCERVNREKESGYRSKMIYFNALIHTVFNLRSNRLMVIADGQEAFRGDCFSIALGNGLYSGGGMCQVPLARMDDGILDVMIVPRQGLPSILKQLNKLFKQNLHESESVVYLRCRTLEIIPLDAKSEDIYELDGEIEGTLPLKVSVTGQRINVLCSGSYLQKTL